ncbi:MAG TPA: glycosyltransferase WbuB, partial [candidate division Zixibacteria bacterium]|nr:glycosyltransferase WbuB [candidate division Zixibacteria bacterium]
NMGYLTKRSPIAVLWKSLNRKIFREASFIVVLGRDVQKVVRNRMPLNQRHKVVYIPNWADPSLIRPLEFAQNPFVKQLGLENKFIVQYSGNMGLTHDMETIIDAARELQNDRTIHFLLIGGGGKLSKIKEMARSYKLHNVTLLPYQPRENLRNSLSAAHVSLISLEKGAEGLSVPSKLYGILASRRPAIAIMAKDSEVAITLKEFRCGLVTPPKDVAELVKAITWLKSNECERKAMGERGYKAFLENFTVQRCAEQYYHLMKQMAH